MLLDVVTKRIPGIRRIEATVTTSNAPSAQLFEQLGAQA